MVSLKCRAESSQSRFNATVQMLQTVDDIMRVFALEPLVEGERLQAVKLTMLA